VATLSWKHCIAYYNYIRVLPWVRKIKEVEGARMGLGDGGEGRGGVRRWSESGLRGGVVEVGKEKTLV
jgi:hypothetical protein